MRNAGTITANLGKVSLASADAFTLDFYGDDLINLAVDDATAENIVDVSTGQKLSDLVQNSGLLKADGGTVQLTAAAARAVVNSVINNTGNIEAGFRRHEERQDRAERIAGQSTAFRYVIGLWSEQRRDRRPYRSRE